MYIMNRIISMSLVVLVPLSSSLCASTVQEPVSELHEQSESVTDDQQNPDQKEHYENSEQQEEDSQPEETYTETKGLLTKEIVVSVVYAVLFTVGYFVTKMNTGKRTSSSS